MFVDRLLFFVDRTAVTRDFVDRLIRFVDRSRIFVDRPPMFVDRATCCEDGISEITIFWIKAASLFRLILNRPGNNKRNNQFRKKGWQKEPCELK